MGWDLADAADLAAVIDTRADADPEGIEADAIRCPHQARDNGTWPPG